MGCNPESRATLLGQPRTANLGSLAYHQATSQEIVQEEVTTMAGCSSSDRWGPPPSLRWVALERRRPVLRCVRRERERRGRRTQRSRARRCVGFHTSRPLFPKSSGTPFPRMTNRAPITERFGAGTDCHSARVSLDGQPGHRSFDDQPSTFRPFLLIMGRARLDDLQFVESPRDVEKCQQTCQATTGEMPAHGPFLDVRPGQESGGFTLRRLGSPALSLLLSPRSRTHVTQASLPTTLCRMGLLTTTSQHRPITTT
jgi:hypothetical protein